MLGLDPTEAIIERENVRGIVVLATVSVGISQPPDIQARENRPSSSSGNTLKSQLLRPAQSGFGDSLTPPPVESGCCVINEVGSQNQVMANPNNVLMCRTQASLSDGRRIH